MPRLTTNYEALWTADPLDRTAGAVTMAREYADKADFVGIHSTCPLPVAQPQGHQPQFVDLTGRRLGVMTVVGYYGPHPNGKGGLWVVRCSCGAYEVRITKTVKLNRDPRHCCRVCDGRMAPPVAGPQPTKNVAQRLISEAEFLDRLARAQREKEAVRVLKAGRARR